MNLGSRARVPGITYLMARAPAETPDWQHLLCGTVQPLPGLGGCSWAGSAVPLL